jgi:hypothetical protein
MNKIRPIAIYLPQYHPIPENDEWWGKGFTEWTNVTKAIPLFKGHKQPRYPADLGYYDLRVSETRELQAAMAKDYGIEGFCYYHYWFGNGKQLLNRPFDEVLDSGTPDFPFMLCWANETWKGVWFGAFQNKVLIEQKYPGIEDYEAHFQHLLKAFLDERYIKINGKPVFYVYKVTELPNAQEFVTTFRNCAERAGLPGIYLLAGRCPLDWNPGENGFDGVIGSEFAQMRYAKTEQKSGNRSITNFLKKFIVKSAVNLNMESRDTPLLIPYKTAINFLITKKFFDFDYFPCVIPNWDNTPRAGSKGMVLTDSTPELWAKHFQDGVEYTKNNKEDRQFVFVKSWNEWAESNYLEPDSEFGYAYLKVIKDSLASE